MNLHFTHTTRALICTALLLTAAQTATALPAITFSGGTPTSPGGDTIGGWEFTLSKPITIDGLGIWDDDSDGIDQEHDIGLWLLDGTLLESVTLAAGATAEANDGGPGRWLFVDIAARVLAPGSYVLGANYFDEDSDQAVINAAVAAIDGLTFVDARQELFTSILTFPSEVIPLGNDGVFGPNMRVVAVAEPTLFSLLGIGLLGVLAGRSRQRS